MPSPSHTPAVQDEPTTPDDGDSTAAPAVASVSPPHAPVAYSITPIRPEAHLFAVTITLDDPAPTERFRLPAWIPGSYMIREFSSQIEQVTARLGKRRLSIEKVDKHTWCCQPGNSRKPLELRYLVYAFDMSVRSAYLDRQRGFFNASSVFMACLGREDLPCRVLIQPPPDPTLAHWRVATTLPADPQSEPDVRGFGAHMASNYDELLDHPVELGGFELLTFSVGRCQHEVVISGPARVDGGRLVRDLQAICQEQIRLFEPERKTAPVRRYQFQVVTTGDGYGGLEHRSSTALICARDDLPWPGMEKTSEGYEQFLGLASHEYFHTWNVKRIKPAAFVPYRLEQESHTRLLWIFEGFTSYYDDLMLCRASVIPPLRYLQMLQKTIRTVLAGPGRLTQSVAESSFDAWTKYYRQNENSPNAIVSYYAKGALVALCLDLTIRQRSDDKASLDDVMRLLWQRHGRHFYGRRHPQTGLEEDGFSALLTEATGLDLSAEIAAWAYGTDDLPLADLLERMGIRYWSTPDPDAISNLGMKTTVKGQDLIIQTVWRDGPAEQAGLAGGDVLIAIDGIRATDALRKKTVQRLPPGTTVQLHAFRRDTLIDTRLTLTRAAAQVSLECHPGHNTARHRWLGVRLDR